MRPVTHDYQRLNAYKFPLQDQTSKRRNRNTYAEDRRGNKYAEG